MTQRLLVRVGDHLVLACTPVQPGEKMVGAHGFRQDSGTSALSIVSAQHTAVAAKHTCPSQYRANTINV